MKKGKEKNDYMQIFPSQIGPAWLLLSHGAFIGAIIASSAIAYAFLISGMLSQTVYTKAMAIGWCCMSIIIACWTIYAIHGTYNENRKVAHPTYGSEGFFALIAIVVLLITMDTWTIVQVSINNP